MHALARTTLALACLSSTLSGCGSSRDHISLLEDPLDETSNVVPDYQDCATSFGTLRTDRPFVVGARVTVLAGRNSECIDYSFWSGCRQYAPGPRSQSLRSSDPTVLAQEGTDTWVFLAPGEASLILEIDGQDTQRLTLRAEEAASLEASIVAQAGLDAGDGYDDIVIPPTLVPADGAALLRSGVGVGIVVLARDAEGRALCGHPEVEVTVSGGLSRSADSGTAGLGMPFVLEAADGASDGLVEMTVRGRTVTARLDVIEPAELTELRVVERDIDDPDSLDHLFEATPLAGERAVHGASLVEHTSDTGDCTDVSVRFDRDGLPSNTRFYAQSYCGNDAEPSFEVHLVEAPALGASLTLRPQ